MSDIPAVSPRQDAAPNGPGVCPACGHDRGRPWGAKNGFPLSQCSRCRVIFTRPPAEGLVLQDLYDHYYDAARFTLPPVTEASLEQLVRSCEPFRRAGLWLDVGFGEGGLLSIAERHGWKCYGTEVSPAALGYGTRRGWVVAADADADDRFPAQGFDVVSMVELLEHVPQPARFLNAAARWLRPGGLLYLTTPNAESLNRRLLGPDWSIFAPPEHLTVWTAQGLRSALAASGFLTQEVRTEGLNPSEVLARWAPQRRGAPGVSRNQAGVQLNSALSRTPFRRLLKAGINRILSLLAVGDTLKVRAVRRRGTLAAGGRA